MSDMVAVCFISSCSVLQIHCHPCHLHGNLADLVVGEQVTGRHSEHAAVDRQSALLTSHFFNANGEWLVRVVWLPKAGICWHHDSISLSAPLRRNSFEACICPIKLSEASVEVVASNSLWVEISGASRALSWISKAKGVSGEVEDVFNPQPFHVV
jgi:hypothetical protein